MHTHQAWCSPQAPGRQNILPELVKNSVLKNKQNNKTTAENEGGRAAHTSSADERLRPTVKELGNLYSSRTWA
jgi:hypothetical protein